MTQYDYCPRCGNPVSYISRTSDPPYEFRRCIHCGWEWKKKTETAETMGTEDGMKKRCNLPGMATRQRSEGSIP